MMYLRFVSCECVCADGVVLTAMHHDSSLGECTEPLVVSSSNVVVKVVGASCDDSDA